MEPDVPNATRSGVTHELFRCTGRRDNDDSIQRSRNRGKIRVTGRAFEFSGMRIDRHDLEAGRAQFAKHCVRRLVARTRHPGNGNTLTAQEARHFGRKVHMRSRTGDAKRQTVSGVDRLAQAVGRRNDSEDALVQLIDPGLLRNAG